jgi:hypothetical protein
MMTVRPELLSSASSAAITGRAIEPLAVTFKVASEITGLGLTTLWKYAKDKRIRLIHPPGTRRTLICYLSLKKLLSLEPTDIPQPRRRGRPRKVSLQPANGATP